MGTSASAMYAGVAWIDAAQGPTYAFVDGQAQLVGNPGTIETPTGPGYSCLGFGPGKAELTVSYQRAPAVQLQGTTWMTADVAVEGAINTLSLNVSQVGGNMGCARTALYNNGGSPEYAIVWQDESGSLAVRLLRGAGRDGEELPVLLVDRFRRGGPFAADRGRGHFRQ